MCDISHLVDFWQQVNVTVGQVSVLREGRMELARTRSVQFRGAGAGAGAGAGPYETCLLLRAQ